MRNRKHIILSELRSIKRSSYFNKPYLNFMKPYQNSLPRFELTAVQTDFPREQVTSSAKSADFIRQFYGDDIHIFESFFVLLLNNNLQTIGYAKISQGGITSTVVDVRIVAHYAVNALATHIILAHNHPSGVCKPSQADIELTKRFMKSLSLLEVHIMDHIILTGTSYYSLADNGEI